MGQTNTGQTKNLGIVAPVPKGDWSASQSYDRLNIVRNNNASYIALQSNIAVEPAVTQGWENSWMLIASDGAQGPQGPQGTTNYNNLENLPIFNVDLTTLATPVENEYYRHTGATDTQFINSCIYRYDGTRFIIVGDLDKAIADETYSNALKGYAGGGAIKLDGVSPLQSNVEVNVSGVSNPESVTVSRYGKNLIPFPYYASLPTTSYGITYTLNADNSITVKGTSTGSSLIYLTRNLVLQKGTYTLSGAKHGQPVKLAVYTSDWDNAIAVVGADSPDSMPFTLLEETEVLVYVPVFNGTTADNVTVYPQIEVGETATAYEQYIAPTTYTPDSNGNVTIPILRPSMTLLTNNANALLSATYNRDINAAINGTTETQPLATVDYVNTAIENNKYYQHVFSGGISDPVGTNVVEFTFSMISKQETKLVEVTSSNYTDPSKLITFLSNTFNGNVPNFTGFVSSPVFGFVMRVSAENNHIYVQYKGTDYDNFTIRADSVDLTEIYPITETVIEIK